MGSCNCSTACYALLYSFEFCNHIDGEERAVKRELADLLNLYRWCLKVLKVFEGFY